MTISSGWRCNVFIATTWDIGDPHQQPIPPAWERFREEFRRAKQSYEFTDHLSLRAEHKQIVSQEFVQSVAVAGTRDACVERLSEVAKLDIDRITFALLSGGRRRRLEQLANEVLPTLRDVARG